jgi:hypothetical protein
MTWVCRFGKPIAPKDGRTISTLGEARGDDAFAAAYLSARVSGGTLPSY